MRITNIKIKRISGDVELLDPVVLATIQQIAEKAIIPLVLAAVADG